jgi:hypothetical protein
MTMALIINNTKVKELFVDRTHEVKSLYLNDSEQYPHREKTENEFVNESIDVSDVPVSSIHDPDSMTKILGYSNQVE